MLWFGSPLPGAMMWSIVQFAPSRLSPHTVQIGSSIFLACSLAFRHSVDWCQSATICLIEEYVGAYLFHPVEDVFDVFAWFDGAGFYFVADPLGD